MNNKALIVVKESKIRRIFNFIKNIFVKNDITNKISVENIEEKHENVLNELDDFQILEKIINGEILLEEIEENTKIRLISMCNNRLNDVKKQVAIKKNKIQEMNNLLGELNKI